MRLAQKTERDIREEMELEKERWKGAADLEDLVREIPSATRPFCAPGSGIEKGSGAISLEAVRSRRGRRAL